MITLAVSILVISAIIPTSMDQLYAANTTNWTFDGDEDTRTTNIWELLPLFIVLAILLLVISIALKYV